MKKGITWMMAVAMAASLSISSLAAGASTTVDIHMDTSAQAADEGTGGAGNETGTQEVKRTYAGYRLLDYTESTQTNEQGETKKIYTYTVHAKYRDALKGTVIAYLGKNENAWDKTTLGDKPNEASDISDAKLIAFLETLSEDTAEHVNGKSVTVYGTLQDFAKLLYETYIKGNKIEADAKTNAAGVFESQNQGYWMIIDTTTGLDTSAKSMIVVDTKGAGSLNVTPKVSVPSFDKKVIKEDGTEEDVATDYNIGDLVEFKLVGTVADNYASYETYKYVFHDTLSSGLTLDLNTANLKVYVDGSEDPLGTNLYQVTTNPSDKCSLHVTFDDLTKYDNIIKAGSQIEVRYQARLNENAVIGNKGDANSNKNEAYVEFSNDPFGDGTGKTPKDEVYVFTFQLNGIKVDANSKTEKDGVVSYTNHLKDAEFVLSRNVTKDGVETTEYYTSVTNAEGKKTVAWKEATTDENQNTVYPEGSTLKSNDQGLFEIPGLDQGTYSLKEIKAPAGYKPLEKPIEIEIKATYASDKSDKDNILTGVTISIDKKEAQNGTTLDGKYTGIVEVIVENIAGSQLPETGGMGTTILYLIGGVLIIGAGALLIFRKRNEE